MGFDNRFCGILPWLKQSWETAGRCMKMKAFEEGRPLYSFVFDRQNALRF
jgi:hypothetical protein